MGETCETCRFWKRWAHLKHLGSCQRFPPQWTGEADRAMQRSPIGETWGNWSFPVMKEDALCGERQPVEKDEK